jgi:amino acid transporter
MRCLTCALVLTFGSALFAPVAYGQSDVSVLTMEATAPKFPTPLQAAIVGLSLTAVVVIGARVASRSSDIMMYMVLGCLALTAVMVAYSDRVHSDFVRAGFEQLEQYRQQMAVAQK